MAVKLEGSIKRFIGTSRDDKSIDDVPEGSSFLETDTGEIYRFRQGRWWLAETSDEQVQLLAAILGELTALREYIEMVVN